MFFCLIRFVRFSRNLDVLRAQRIMGFFLLICHKWTGSENPVTCGYSMNFLSPSLSVGTVYWITDFTLCLQMVSFTYIFSKKWRPSGVLSHLCSWHVRLWFYTYGITLVILLQQNSRVCGTKSGPCTSRNKDLHSCFSLMPRISPGMWIRRRGWQSSSFFTHCWATV